MNRFSRFIAGLVTAISAIAGLSCCAIANDDIAGQVIAEHEGEQIALPLLTSDYKIDIEGTVATVEVTQIFSNPSDIPLNAQYLFPLNKDAAVFAMKLEVGNEVIEAVIQEKTTAKKTFEKAKSEGKAAALLRQHRPNMFTQNIANLMPAVPIKVTLSYVQSLLKTDGDYNLVVPMIVAPRYRQAAEIDNTDGWHVRNQPAYPKVAGLNLPNDQLQPRVTLSAKIRSGLPISGLASESHELDITGDDNVKSLTFKKGSTFDDRDFTLSYSLEGDTLQAGVLATYTQDGGFASIVVEPPKAFVDAMVTPRELIFLIDASGSQQGEPLRASKKFITAALNSLRPQDYFRIVQFENSVTSFSKNAVPATAQNIEAGKHFVQNLNAGGGTDIDAAIRASFATKRISGTLPIVVFLSDGLVGNEARVIKRIRQEIGETRIYSFGVGTSVNRYLMDGVAKYGRGYARYIDPTDDASEVAVRFASNLGTPILTDIAVDWGDLDAINPTPPAIPDLFAGGSASVVAQYNKGGKHRIKVTGKVNGTYAELPMDIDLPSAPAQTASSALPLIWARNQIAQKTLDYNTGIGNKDRLQKEVTALGLKHSLQSQFTSFVAVSKKVYNEQPQSTLTKSVPLPKVAGTSSGAYPSAIAGSSTPEPETLFGLLIALGLAALRYSKMLLSRFSKFTSKKDGDFYASL